MWLAIEYASIEVYARAAITRAALLNADFLEAETLLKSAMDHPEATGYDPPNHWVHRNHITLARRVISQVHPIRNFPSTNETHIFVRNWPDDSGTFYFKKIHRTRSGT